MFVFGLVALLSLFAPLAPVFNLAPPSAYAQTALGAPGGAPALLGSPPTPDVYAGIKLELKDEGIGPDRRWYQTFRATIRSGGTISDVAMAVYNNIGRSDEVFKLAQTQNPDLKSPAFVYVGQTIDITVDPTLVSVFKETKREQNGALTKHFYYNGVVETYFADPKSGVLRTIEFPADPRASTFVFADDFEGKEENVSAKPGTRLVDYRYVAGDSFGDVTRKIFGTNSVKAANALIQQSGWDANSWPPSGEGRTRVVVDTQSSYVDERPKTLDYVPAEAASRDLWGRLSAQRETAGIYPLRMEKDGIVYQGRIGSGSLTAKDVSRLLFNADDHFLDVARAAGLQLPAEDPAKVPAGYNPLLVGRTFEVKVPFAQERFAVTERAPGADGALVTRLANGTLIEEYERAPGESGLLRVIHMPSGYRSMLARPSGLMLLGLDFLHFQMVNLANPELPREERERLAREFQARMLWNWSRSMPRALNDVAEDLHLNVTEKDTTFEVLARERRDVPWQEALVYQIWFAYPVVLAGALVGLATVVLFAISLRSRREQDKRWRERLGRRS